ARDRRAAEQVGAGGAHDERGDRRRGEAGPQHARQHLRAVPRGDRGRDRQVAEGRAGDRLQARIEQGEIVMPYAPSAGAKLYYEEAGRGHPVIFAHEFGGDYRSWEQQVRWFSRHYRCIAFNFRGYPPSDVPQDEALYAYTHFADDIGAVLKHLGLDKAHVVGLSQGAYAALQFGIRHPGIATSLVLAGCGSGSATNAAEREKFLKEARARADRFLKEGTATIAKEMAVGPNRLQLNRKDPRGNAD